MKKIIKYICYETNQCMTKLGWMFYYNREIDHNIYGTFNLWWADMMRSHVLERA